MEKNRYLGLLGIAAKAGKVVAGADACKEAIEKNKVKLLLVAGDASERTKRNFQMICERKKTPMVIIGEIEVLSKAIGKNNKAVIGIKDENLFKEIYKIINGGDASGKSKNTRNS